MYLKVLIKALESRDKMKKELKALTDSFWKSNLLEDLTSDDDIGYSFDYYIDDIVKTVIIIIDICNETITLQDLINALKEKTNKDIKDNTISNIIFNMNEKIK
jgi:hypothetical protein